MARRTPPRKVTCFEPVAPHLAHNMLILSAFEVGPPFPLHDACRLPPARYRFGYPAGARRVAHAAGAPSAVLTAKRERPLWAR